MAGNDNRRGLSRWLVRGLSRLLVLVLVFVAGAVAMHLGMHAGDREHMQMLQTQNGDLQARLAQAQASLATLQNQAGVQGGAQQSLQDKLVALQQQLGHAQEQLAFYEQLLPPGPAGSVAVRAFSIQPQGDRLQYRVLLTRSVAPDQAAPFLGELRFTATGLQDGKAVQVALKPAMAAVAAPGAASQPAEAAPAAQAGGPLALSFDQFQRSTGLLQGVPGLMIQSVRVDVVEGDTVRATQDASLNRTEGTTK